MSELFVQQERWADLAEQDYAQIVAVWEQAFPPAERHSEDSVTQRNSTWLWTARSADKQVVGFATAISLPTLPAAYLEYLAVDSTQRGQGTGAALLATILADLCAQAQVRGIMLEVEDPVRTPGSDPLLARRLGFYARWGAHPVRYLHDYSMPDLSSPGDRVPMVILWRGIVAGDELEREDVKQLLIDLYRGYYAHVAPEGHLDEMIGLVI